MTTLVKICGVTRLDDASFAAEEGAEFLGLNFWSSSKRYVEASRANELAAAARAINPNIEIVGVFVNPSDEDVRGADEAAELDWLQLHGDELPERVRALGPRAFKAVAVATEQDARTALAFPGELLVLDTPTIGYGGSGRVFDWDLCSSMAASGRRWLLAGGLDPENVARAVAAARPTGVDVASGVESSPGIKDHSKIRAFIRAAKGIQ